MVDDSDLTAALVAYAGRDIVRWREVEGQTATSRHSDRGFGTIVRVEDRAGRIGIVVHMLYKGGQTVAVSGAAFAQVHSGLSLPDDLKAKLGTVRPNLRPRHAARAPSRPDTSAASPMRQRADYGRLGESTRTLAELTRKAEEGHELVGEDLEWLGRRGHETLLERYLELQKQRGEYMPEAKICSFWRQARIPSKALAATFFVEDRGGRPQTDRFAWTCRAAAFADVFDEGKDSLSLDEAHRCARNALTCRKNDAYAFNCLGRIWFLKGDSDKADKYFSLALKHAGTSEEHVHAEGLGGLGRSLRAVPVAERAQAVEEFLRKDATRYKRLLRNLPAGARRELVERLVAEDPEVFGPVA